MTGKDLIERHLARYPWIAAAVYVGCVLVFVSAIWGAVADVLDRRSEVAVARDIAARLQGRGSATASASREGEITPMGSALLEGPSVTVAGAALLQRVASAVTKVGGNMLSSQVELRGTESKSGLIGVITSCELDQPALQQLLYDLEAGMPYLFVEQLVVQAPGTSAGAEGGRMRILLAVYGQWQGGP
jgi:general secretion pathway protein M